MGLDAELPVTVVNANTSLKSTRSTPLYVLDVPYLISRNYPTKGRAEPAVKGSPPAPFSLWLIDRFGIAYDKFPRLGKKVHAG